LLFAGGSPPRTFQPRELATFEQHRRAGDRLTVLVFDNALLGRVAFGFVGARGCELAGPDYVALARAYGGDGRRVAAASDVPAAVDAAARAPPGLFLLHVKIDPSTKADMATFHDSSIAVMNSG
jgi:thiamine pyrophosphate-dependent acetolactate synthase large subunit-like protein